MAQDLKPQKTGVLDSVSGSNLVPGIITHAGGEAQKRFIEFSLPRSETRTRAKHTCALSQIYLICASNMMLVS